MRTDTAAVLAAMIILRQQTIVSHELAPTTPAVVTVGSVHVGSKSNVIGDRAVLELNVRTYDEATRTTVLDAIRRIVRAECAASESPKEPEFELYDRLPATINDPDATDRVRETFAATSADRAGELPLQSASEDFRNLLTFPTPTGESAVSTRQHTGPAETVAGTSRSGRSSGPCSWSPVFGRSPSHQTPSMGGPRPPAG